MNDHKIYLPWQQYHLNLKVIRNVAFTSKEIDIIACLINRKESKAISPLLSISSKTVDTHIQNIMRKLDCNFRGRIIHFVEKSDQFFLLKEHYATLLTKFTFEKNLCKITNHFINQKMTCKILFSADSLYLKAFFFQLRSNLESVGIQTSIEVDILNGIPIDKEQCSNNNCTHIILEKFNFSKQDEESNISKKQEIKQIFVIFSSMSDGDRQIQKQSHYIYIKISQDYYTLCAFILSFFCVKIDLLTILEDHYLFEKIDTLTHESKNIVFWQLKKLAYQFREIIVTIFFTLIFLVFAFLFYMEKTTKAKNQLARSNLIIPNEIVFLNRSNLIHEIKTGFKKQSRSIRTIALVGIGGAGKTTLAHQYAKLQRVEIVWEINAETKNSLISSFEGLAYILAKAEEEQKILKDLIEIKNLEEKAEKIILFVKDKLKKSSQWFLIFDNIENFAEIQKYFPSDSGTWGQGDVIVTSRNANMCNNGYINHVIKIKELNPKEKIELFLKISDHQDRNSSLNSVKKETENFLNELPSFPLDICVAAYYLKINHISYEKYLDYIKEYTKDFENMNKNLLQESTSYEKTRYSIITLSMQKIIDSHPDFKDLLFMIASLETQNIPVDLLNFHKSDIVADRFLYHLKKYSLITEENVHSIPTFFIHRSTHAIISRYMHKVLNLDPNSQVKQSNASILANYMTKVIDDDNFLKMKLMIDHCKKFKSHFSSTEHHYLTHVNTELSGIFFYLSFYREAQVLLEKNLEDIEKYHHVSDFIKARTMVHLGNVYRHMKRYNEAADLIKEALGIYETHNHSDIAWTLANLGIIYKELGCYEKAINFFKQSLEAYEKYSYNKTKKVWVMTLLGITYKDFGYMNKAQELLQECLAIYKDEFSHNYVRIAYVSTHLGHVYSQLNNYNKALDLLKQGFIFYKRHFFYHHIEPIRTLNFLGSVHKNLQNYEEAIFYLRQSLDLCKESCMQTQDYSASVSVNLAQVYLLKKEYKTAEHYINNVVKIFQSKEHPDYYLILENLSDFYAIKYHQTSNLDDYMKALEHCTKALEIAKIHFPKDSYHIERIQLKIDKLNMVNKK